jgi:hypothetical protein
MVFIAPEAARAQADVPKFGITKFDPAPMPSKNHGWKMIDRNEKTRFTRLKAGIKKQEEAAKAAEELAKRTGKTPPSATKNSVNMQPVGNVGGIGSVSSEAPSGGIGIVGSGNAGEDTNPIGTVGGIGKVGAQ